MGTMQLSLALAGEKVVIGGLALQVATFVVFLVAAADFNIRMNRVSKTNPDSPKKTWKKMICILYTLSALIMLRCTFRLIEYAMGNAAYLIAHEWTLYVFDGVPMLTVLLLLLVLQPSRLSTEQKTDGNESSDGELGAVGGQ